MRFSNLLWFLIFAALWMTLPRESVALGDPSIVWTLELGPQFAECPVPYPSESPNSLIFATGGHVTRVDGSGKVIFKVDLGPEEGRGMMFWPSIADVDGDGMEEIIAGRNDGFVYALNADDGDILWECQSPERLTNYEWADSADLDGDGRAEVVVTTMYGWVYAIDDDGTILWGSKMEDYRPSAPTIADIDSDGEPKIVYGTATRYMISLDAHGDLEWASFRPPHHLGRTVPLVADLDKDGQAEVYGMSSMLSPDKGLVCLNGSDGDLLWHGLTIGKAYSGRALTRFSDGSLGVLSCDKGGNIHAHQSDGALRWHNRLSGRGVHNPPVTADIDGDGNLEVVATVRDTSTDGEGNNWYVLSADTGQILGAWNHPKLGFMGPAVLDIDRDGDLEVILCSKEGIVTAYSFGGPAIPESIAFGHVRQRTFPVRVAASHETSEPTVPPIQLIDEIPPPRFGSNLLTINLPDSEEGTLAIELSVTDPDGFRSIQVFRGEDGQVEASWRALIPGDYGITLRLIDLNSNKSLGSQDLSLRLKDAGAIADLTQEALNHFEDSMKEDGDDNLVIQLRASEIEARSAKLSSAIQKSLEMNVSQRRAVADDADEYVQFLARSVDFSSLVSSEISSGRKPKFVCWQDQNPWDNRNPLDDLPDHGEPPVIRSWAFGNEKESVCFNILNLSNDPLTLRVEPGKVTGPEPLPKVSEVTTLHRVLWLPTSDGAEIADLLPRLDEGYLLDLAPGEARQLWINLSTRELSEGVYEFVWPLRSLDMDTLTTDLTVQLEVSPVRLPDESRFYTGYWSRTSLDGFNTIPDLNDHLQTLWDSVPAMPKAEANADGQLVGQLDWSLWDAFLDQIEQYGVIRLHHVPVPTFPKGVEVSEELRLKAQRNYVNAWFDHMKKYGLDDKNFAFYVEDETGLTGTHENFMKAAKHLKEIDPRLQVYANPWGAITKEMLRDMAPLTDVWQPGMEVIEYHGPEVVEIMRADGDRLISMYTPPGNCRTLLPLGFFRSQSWIALNWKIEGGGWWVYRQDDLFGTGPHGDPSYGGVNWDGRSLVWSRRWEAMRDGVEDFNAVVFLRDLAEAANDSAALKTIDEAVSSVASECITGMPREAADYDMDFEVFMKHREAIRQSLERLSE